MSPEATALRNFMSALSEEAWSAAWKTDLEYDLWIAVEQGPRPYGRLDVTEQRLAKLRELSAACGGWIYFPASATREEFVPLDAWKHLVARRASERSRPGV